MYENTRDGIRMYQRSLTLPNHSFFLFGPRGTGKTTWLRQALPDAKWFNLLLEKDYLSLASDPELFGQVVSALPKGSWVVVDEVQRLPYLLDAIHNIISVNGDRYKFALSGSSARKLKLLNANLLAGRVLNKRAFPLTTLELASEADIKRILSFGTLPDVYQKPEFAVDILEAYALTYLKEEIQQEMLVRDVPSYNRFLKVAALMNGQIINVAGIARDSGVARTTVQRYFDTLVDTLIGFWLPSWQPKLKVREVGKPKFYLFDPGVVRVLSGRIRETLNDLEKGPLLETFVLTELRAAISYLNIGGELSFWRSESQSEVDFIWTRAEKAIGIEVKASNKWHPNHGKALREMLNKGQIQRAFGVYLGEHKLVVDNISIFPALSFFKELAQGKILN